MHVHRDVGARIDRFERVISIDGEVSEELAGKIVEIAGKCPVHRTLETGAKISALVKGTPAWLTRRLRLERRDADGTWNLRS